MLSLRRHGRGAVAFIALVLTTAPAEAQEREESTIEQQARLQRQGAGLRIGIWDVRGLQEQEDVEYANTPFFEGYFQRGLDLHLAIESSVALWRREQTVTSAGTIGGTSTEKITSYVVPLFSGIRFFPFTRPGTRFEPYIFGGVGFVIGIDDIESTSGGLFGGSSGTVMATGFGAKVGVGLETRLSRALALDLSGRYHWIRFTDDIGEERDYKGPGVDIGLSYRFQYQ